MFIKSVNVAVSGKKAFKSLVEVASSDNLTGQLFWHSKKRTVDYGLMFKDVDGQDCGKWQ